MIELINQDYIKSYLLRPENIDALEGCLDSSSSALTTLARLRPNFPPDRKLDDEEIINLTREVMNDTREFLGISDAPTNKIYVSIFDLKEVSRQALSSAVPLMTVMTYFSHGVLEDRMLLLKIPLLMGGYSVMGVIAGYTYFNWMRHLPGNKIIAVTDKRETRVADLIADTYDGIILYDNTRSILENPIAYGHILRVRGEIGKSLNQRYDNEAYLYEPLRDATGALKDAYMFVCGENGNRPRDSLRKIKAPSTPSSYVTPLMFGPMHRKWVLPQNLGVAALAVAEQSFGSNIYGLMLREDFSFLR